GHGREAVLHARRIALRLEWIAPRPVDTQAALARDVLAGDVVLVIRACGGTGCVHDVVPSVIQLVFPRAASQHSALSPGRKKYAPPRTDVKVGRPTIVLRMGRFGILYSSVPS